MTEEEFRGWYPGTNKLLPPVDATPLPLEKDPVLWDSKPFVKWVNGEQREFFTIGALCMALERPAVTIRLWIRQGRLPPATFRMPTVNGIAGRRLYTRSQIEDIVRVATEHQVLGVKAVDWSAHPTFKQDVLAAWADSAAGKS